MPHRYWMHWYADPAAPLKTGRALPGRTQADAIAQATALWKAWVHAAAYGYCVVDTDDGAILWRREH